MQRTRLLLLCACALLSTTIQLPPSLVADPVVAPAVAIAGPTIPPIEFVQALERIDVMIAENEARLLEMALIAEIFERLSNRHTGLAKRERQRVARAIVTQARMHDLEPELVIAVIEVESAGYALAVSHVGAMGLMQLLPSTAEELAGKHDIPWRGEDTLFDPVVNVQLGTAYLRELADRYGKVDVALAAYNWGPGRIDRRLRRGAAVPSKYIQQVMRAYDRNTTLASRRS